MFTMLTWFTWPFVSRRVCGKIYRSQPTSPHSTFFTQTIQWGSLGQEQLVGGGWLQTSYQSTICISGTCAEQLHESYGQCSLLENWRTKRSGQSACARNDDRFSEQLSVLCMTYLGWVGTYKAQSCRHAASTLLERSPLIEPPLVRTFVLQMLPN